MKIRAKVNVLLAVTVLSGMTASARAESEWTVAPFAEIGVVDYELAFSGTVPLPGGVVLETDQSFFFDVFAAKVGVGVSYGKVYALAHYQDTTEASDSQVTSGLPVTKWVGSRSELGVGIGYSVSEAINVFGGYRESESKGTGSDPGSSYTFEHDGFFLGTSYFLNLNESGGLNFSLGYAWLDAAAKQTLPFGFKASGDGDGSGLKYGVAWKGFINDNWGYSIAAERFDYDYELSANSGIELDVEESETILSIGLNYAF